MKLDKMTVDLKVNVKLSWIDVFKLRLIGYHKMQRRKTIEQLLIEEGRWKNE